MKPTTFEALADRFRKKRDIYVEYPREVLDVRRYASLLHAELVKRTKRSIRMSVDGVGVRFTEAADDGNTPGGGK